MSFIASLLAVVAVCSSGVSCQSNSEIADVSAQIWDADRYRWPADGVIINQNGPDLFAYVDESRFGTPINRLYKDLLDNYEPVIGVPETCGSACRAEEEAFLDEMLSSSSRPMRIAHDFLVAKGLASSSLSGFKTELRQYWFDFYSRSGGSALDSSGFEHVFLGEIRSNGNDVTGFHNWIQAYFLEQDGEFEYGNFQRLCNPDILKFSFNWNADWGSASKSVSSMWIGTTAEVEMALYTLCFVTRANSSCTVRLGGVSNTMQAYDMSGVSFKTVGSVYPAC